MALTFLFLLTAGVTWVGGEAGQGAEGRLTLADAVGVMIIGFALAYRLASGKLTFRVPIEYRAYLPLLVVFALGVVFSTYPGRGALELVIHLFIFGVSVALFNLHCRIQGAEVVEQVLVLLLYSGAILALLGLVDFFVWPSLLPGQTSGVVGTFRNTGQSGAFFGMYLATLLPALFAGLIRPSKINIILFLSIAVALVFTFKRAALLGAVIGFILLAISMALSNSKRDKKYGLFIIVIGALIIPVGIIAFQWGLQNIEGMSWRFGAKFNENAIEDFSEGFLAENIGAAWAGFSINPAIGVGLGNIAGVVTSKYEIHSSYLAIVGTSGLLGLFAYGWFMFVFAMGVVRSNVANAYGLYLRYFAPMLVGLMVAWAYTYHLRKREFWIMFFIVAIIRQWAGRKQPIQAVTLGARS